MREDKQYTEREPKSVSINAKLGLASICYTLRRELNLPY